MTRNYEVTNSDDQGEGTLREAIRLANSSPGKDNIFLGVDVELESSIDITDSVNIGTKFGANITQNGKDRVFNIDDGDSENTIETSLYRLNISGGKSSSFGGAILSQEDLNITDSRISNNYSLYSGGAIYQEGGSLRLERSEIYNNIAGLEDDYKFSTGGGLYMSKSLYNITGSIIQGNESTAGQGVYLLNSSGQITNSELEDSLLAVNIPIFKNSISETAHDSLRSGGYFDQSLNELINLNLFSFEDSYNPLAVEAFQNLFTDIMINLASHESDAELLPSFDSENI